MKNAVQAVRRTRTDAPFIAAAVLLMFAAPATGFFHDAPDIERGRRIYAETCAACHGATLEGQPNWQEGNPDGTYPAPPHDQTGIPGTTATQCCWITSAAAGRPCSMTWMWRSPPGCRVLKVCLLKPRSTPSLLTSSRHGLTASVRHKTSAHRPRRPANEPELCRWSQEGNFSFASQPIGPLSVTDQWAQIDVFVLSLCAPLGCITRTAT